LVGVWHRTGPDLGRRGTEAVELARRENPDIILMDFRMPGMDGIEATRQIIAAPQTVAVRVLILTTFDLDEYVFAALCAGASGFPLKDTRQPTCWPRSGWSRRRRAARPRRHPAAYRGVHPEPRIPTAPDGRAG
jgi:chemotaxis response regulator CheB